MEERFLFRGKQVGTGKWVYGSYIPKLMVCLTEYSAIFALDIDGDGGDEAWQMVDPATVGQCTGLRDKNGTLIFEGDIVRINSRRRPKYDDYYRVQSVADGECEVFGTVVFKNYKWQIDYDNIHNEQIAALKGKEESERTVDSAHNLSHFDTATAPPNNFENPHFVRMRFIEIVGNIHDNPELLEV